MKILKKILAVFLVVFIVIFSIGYVFASIFAKNIIKGQIEKQLKLKSEISSVSLSLPLNLEVNGFVLDGLAKIKKIKLSPSLAGLFTGKIILNNITLINPEITLERREDGTFNLPRVPQQGKNQVLIAGLFIKDGIVSVKDKKAGDGTFSFSVNDINVKISKGSLLPYPITIKYALSATLPARAEMKKGQVQGSGLIDWSHKDMQGDFKIYDIDVMFFKPYFSGVVSSDEQLKTSLAYLSADLSAKNNDLLIKCRLNVKNLAVAQETPPTTEETTPSAQEKPSAEEALAMLGIGLLQNRQGEIILQFDIKTRLDNPFSSYRINLKGSVFQDVLENAIQNPEKTAETLKDISEQFKDKGKELKKTFKEIFKKDSRE